MNQVAKIWLSLKRLVRKRTLRTEKSNLLVNTLSLSECSIDVTARVDDEYTDANLVSVVQPNI